jgi:GxxExxY protein
MQSLHQDLTEQILAACFQVSNELGAGFVESVYQNALAIVLREKGLQVDCEYPSSVSFHGQTIGSFYADLFVEEKVIVELKAVSALTDGHKAQIINYLKATGIDLGLLVNFGNPKLEWRNFTNRLKQSQTINSK